MVQVVKQHKVTGEIVKVDAKSDWIGLDGTIPAPILAKIKAATEANTDYIVLDQEGRLEREPVVKTARQERDELLAKLRDAEAADRDAMTRAVSSSIYTHKSTAAERQAELDAFDAVHPEIVAEIEAEHKARAAAAVKYCDNL